MPAALPCSDPVEALNERARTLGWTFVCHRLLVFEAPKLMAMLGLWQSRSRPGLLPARAAFSARDLKDVLPDLMILDVVPADDANRFRFRYMGTRCVSYLGEHTGSFLDDALPPLAFERTKACYQALLDARCPLRFVTQFSVDEINFLRAEFFAAPLSSDGVVPDMIMTITCFASPTAPGRNSTALMRTG